MRPVARIAGAAVLQLSMLVTRRMIALQGWLREHGIEWEAPPPVANEPHPPYEGYDPDWDARHPGHWEWKLP